MRAGHFWLSGIVLGLGAALVGILPAAAIGLANPQAASGRWDIGETSGAHKCQITLRADAAPGGMAVGIPFGCRKALPVLAPVKAWALRPVEKLSLSTDAGASVLDFLATATGLEATGPNNMAYRLGPAVAPVEAKPATPGFQTAQVAAKPAAAGVQSNPATTPARAADLPGRYAILRDGTKDTGCMLTLDDKMRGPGGNRAALAPACRDNGMVIFDPKGWNFSGGKLSLTARKGHSTKFDHQQDGSWMKDPKEGGKALSIRKM